MEQKLSEAESEKRALAEATVVDIQKRYGADSVGLLSSLEERERITRLQADQASCPIYAEALMKTSFEQESPAAAIKRFRYIFKSRAQAVLSQQLIAVLAWENLQKYYQALDKNTFLELAGEVAEALSGAIHVEEYFLRTEIMRLRALVSIGRREEAAMLAERLQTDTSTLPYEEKLQYILEQIGAVQALGSHTRALLAFQKYNDVTARRQTQTPTLAKLRREILTLQAVTYKEEKNMLKLAQALRTAAECAEVEGTNTADLRKQALVAAVCCMDHATIATLLAAKTPGSLAKLLRKRQICAPDEIEFDASSSGLQHELRAGFIGLQILKAQQVFKRLSFQRLEELLRCGVEEVEENVFGVLQNAFNLQIDCEAREIVFQEPTEKQADPAAQVRKMLQAVADVGYAVYAK